MKTATRTTLACGLALGLGLGVFFSDRDLISSANAAQPKIKTDATALAQPNLTFGPVIKRVSPSVVNIFTSRTVKENARGMGGQDEMLRDFFGFGGGQQGVPRERQERSLGSGVIVSEDGYIMTNNHVVDGADEIKVALNDNQTTYTAKIIGTDPHTDIAVIKVEAKGLPAITVTDSDNVDVGDVVLAIGNPFGVGQTVTMGIVSAKGRAGMGIVDYEDFIQTDASVNPGNSGGALIDAGGRLVGINTAILSRTGGNQGVGFAVPVNLARNVMERLIADGKVTRGYLGVMIQPLTPELAKEFHVPGNSGALVGEVTKNSPAAKAGLKEGDVVTEFNNRKVVDSRNLRLMVSQTAPETKTALKLIRDGKEKTMSVTLAAMPENGIAKADGRFNRSMRVDTDALAGVTLEDLDQHARSQFKIPADVRGALVTDVAAGSSAAAAGLRPGSVILEINRKPVTSASEAVELAEQAANNRALMRVWSGGGVQYVVIEGKNAKG